LLLLLLLLLLLGFWRRLVGVFQFFEAVVGVVVSVGV